MYTRPENRYQRNKAIHLPENYGGNAFSERALPKSDDISPIDEPDAEPTLIEIPDDKKDSKGGKLRIFDGIGGEELLILGIILLLSQSDEGSDLLPILVMLLFFKGEK